MKRFLQPARPIWLLLIAALVAGCASMPTAAPVIDRSLNATPPPIPTQSTPKVKASPPAVAAKSKSAPATPPAVAQKAETAVVAKAEEPDVRPYREGDWRPEFHTVKKGDTLYSIALDYGQDYKELAAWNNLEDPGLIKIDQRLRLFPPDSTGELAAPQAVPLPAEAPAAAVPLKTEPKASKLPYSEEALARLKDLPRKPPAAAPSPPAVVQAAPKPVAKPPAAVAPVAADGKLVWEWPTQGKVIYGFGQGQNQKGVGIEGKTGQPVLASAPGKVVYSGSGLRGYGKLIIIKHNTSYLSVYAHNSQILVKEGQSVAKGQKIAEMGDTDNDRIALHFEIRRLGKPIDPLQYLPERSS